MAKVVGFLGAGQMATALARGWLAAPLINPARSLAADPYAHARTAFAAATGLSVGESNRSVVERAEVLVLAVKPQVMAGLLSEIKPWLRPDQLIVSIAAGIPIVTLAECLPAATRIIRVMPNMPCLIGQSATGIAMGPAATADDMDLVTSLFAAVGMAVRVPESQLDAVTGLSGSGPAYVYVMIEALADGGVHAGLPRETAMTLAVQTVLGAAAMVKETKQHPAALKDAVASPGGTTISGLHALEKAGFRAALMDAVVAATDRAAELGHAHLTSD
jgi:pyrroline-5-carboxylate reductase